MPAMDVRVGGKFRLGRKIGSGSFGDIYLGELCLLVRHPDSVDGGLPHKYKEQQQRNMAMERVCVVLFIVAEQKNSI